MTREQVINEIRKVCNAIGADAALMLAIAELESSLRPNATSPSGTFVGLYQLSNGYGGCTGDQRKNIAQATKCTWSQIQRNKTQWHRDFREWEDWFAYGMHQQGVAGFKTLYRNRNNKVNELPAARQNAIRTNTPATVRVVYVKDFLNFWRDRVNSRKSEYTLVERVVEKVKEVREEVSQAAKVLENTMLDMQFNNTKLLVYGGVALIVCGGAYFTWKSIKN